MLRQFPNIFALFIIYKIQPIRALVLQIQLYFSSTLYHPSHFILKWLGFTSKFQLRSLVYLVIQSLEKTGFRFSTKALMASIRSLDFSIPAFHVATCSRPCSTVISLLLSRTAFVPITAHADFSDISETIRQICLLVYHW